MASEKWVGGTLVLISVLLLTASGKLDWFVVLLPVSILLGYGMVRFGKKSRLTPGLKKG